MNLFNGERNWDKQPPADCAKTVDLWYNIYY